MEKMRVQRGGPNAQKGTRQGRAGLWGAKTSIANALMMMG